MKRLLTIIREIRATRSKYGLTPSDVAFALWVELGAVIFLSGDRP